ncbi:hypothetical protein PAXRUDRAFT_631145 [Paxillus rubicundulus Ve08.2h10]|uniref:Uncharacterized protein n=1 Tax=Paxillus rubicundulus Ve08.2h10 TaxID=930991 RepID=A0A0D0E390_9AGAM|nr:hypothetical protein PAXRUDRAFT_631145 [Paxillus rubicundulus Ve08.2h10]
MSRSLRRHHWLHLVHYEIIESCSIDSTFNNLHHSIAVKQESLQNAPMLAALKQCHLSCTNTSPCMPKALI